MIIYNYFKRLPALAFIAMLLCAGTFLSSCDDEEVISDDVVLESFGPTGVKHGESIKFIGRNLDRVTAIELPGAGEISSSDFTTRTSELIELVVPRTAQAGRVTLKTPDGDLTSKAMLSFEVPVTIESITAEAKPGTDITITGDMVNWIEEITFPEGIVVTEFVSSSLNELVVTVPMEAQTGQLIFSSGGTEPLSFASEEELIVTLPAVTALDPAAIQHTQNLTIKGTDLDLVTGVMFSGVEEAVTSFESQSATEIVVAVPANAVKGTLTLLQASPVEVVTSQELTIILPKGTALAPQPAVPGQDDITITGENLDLVASLTLPGVAVPIAAADFKSHTAEEIVLALPEGAAKGGVKYTTIHGYTSNLGVNVVLPGAGPAPLAISLYDETIEQGGGNWSWNDVVNDPASTEEAYSGTVSWKFETDSEGGLSVGGMTAIDASEMGVFAFSLFGGPGTDGAEVAVILNDDWNNTATVTLAEGKWTHYEVPLSEFGSVNMSAITRFAFKVETMAASTIYADRVGFDTGGPAGPEALGAVIYDDAVANNFEAHGGWSATSDFNSTEEVRGGNNAIKVTYEGNWGGGAQFIIADGADALSTEGATHFVFSMYGGEGTDGNEVKLLIKSPEGELDRMITIVEGEWTDVEVSLEELGGPTAITEMFFQNAEWTGVVHYDHIGLR